MEEAVMKPRKKSGARLCCIFNQRRAALKRPKTLEQNEDSSTSNVSRESSGGSTIEINVMTLDSQIYCVQVEENMLVSVFKEKIANDIGVPVDQQRLIFIGRVLCDDRRLSEYHLENGHTLHLVVRQPAQSQPSSNTSAEETNRTSSTLVLGFQSIPGLGFSVSQQPLGSALLSSHLNELENFFHSMQEERQVASGLGGGQGGGIDLSQMVQQMIPDDSRAPNGGSSVPQPSERRSTGTVNHEVHDWQIEIEQVGQSTGSSNPPEVVVHIVVESSNVSQDNGIDAAEDLVNNLLHSTRLIEGYIEILEQEIRRRREENAGGRREENSGRDE